MSEGMGRVLRLPTMAEARANRVTVNVTADGAMSIEVQGGQRLFTETEVADLQASEGELIGRVLRHDLERERRVSEELRRDLTAMTQQRDAFRTQAYTENERAARLEQQIKELGDKHQRELAALQTSLNSARNRLETVSQHRREAEGRVTFLDQRAERALAALSTGAVQEAVEEAMNKISVTLAGAIAEAKLALRDEA